MGLAPLVKVLPVGLVGPECVAGLSGCRKFPSLPSERREPAFIGYGLDCGYLWQCAILSYF